jgi:hypothetical protein
LWVFILVYQIRSGVRGGWLLALVALCLSLISPFGIVVAIMSIAGVAMVEYVAVRLNKRGAVFPKGWLAGLFWVSLGGLPYCAYSFWVAQADPVLAGWNLQNRTTSPPLWDILLSLSPALVFAIVAIWMGRRQVDDRTRVLIVWAGIGLALMYIPFALQRRFMLGLYVPLAGLAALGAIELAEKAGKLRRFWPVLLVCLALPTNLLILLATQQGMHTHDSWIYLTRGEAQALSWIRENTAPQALFLAGPQTGLFIPAHTGRRVVYGHPFETVQAEQEKARVTEFFTMAGKDPDGGQAAALLESLPVEYIFWGPRELQLGSPPDLAGLTTVYASDGVTIYQVRQP